ncbi:putative NTPase (NACHT family), partial [Xenococcus sp. PCC 7305]|uniref:NACHT domain-containing protein n=1 Tax=Xenococcus sp. PCC 7305 TaxID=102125 RepID=UPI0002ABB4EF
MVEPITLIATWGLTSTAKFLYQSVLEELKKDTTKEWVKDVLGFWLKNVAKDKLSEGSGAVWEHITKLLKKEPLEIAAETAITAFLVLIDNQLADNLGLPEDKRARFQQPLKQFLKEKSVRQILGSPFQEDFQHLDIKSLKETWDELGLRDLPDKFNWEELEAEYSKIVKKIFYESEELRPLLDFQRQEKDSKNLEAIAGVPTDFNLVKYQETILEKYGNLKLESLDSSGYIYDKELKIYQIFIPQNVKECQEYLPQVYELPKDLQRKLKEEGELEREITQEELENYKRAYTDQQIKSVLDVIADDKYKYLVILGDPGSGKSTLLQYLAVEWAKLPPKELPSHPLTLLIELRAYIQDFAQQRCQNFLEFVHKGSSWVCHLNQNELDKRLKQGEVRVLFDGLDEVFDPQQRANVIAQIHSFTQTYDKVKVIVTSRVIGYKPQQLKDAEFHHFMLQDLEPVQIEEFLTKWHDLTYNEATESQKKQDRQQRIAKAIQESQAIQQLAMNPLLLTMMAILNRNQDLPRDRAELYRRSSELLLYQWDVEGKLLEDPELKSVAIDYRDKQAMLRDVAHFMQATEKGLAGNLISDRDLEKILINYLKTIDVTETRKVAKLMVEQLRTRNFILCDIGSNYYAFVHRTFLEYFCAWSYIWQLEAQTLSIEEIRTEVFGKHWQDESWHEVLRLIAGMILDPKNVGNIIEDLMAQDGESAKFANLFLAADCLAEVRNRKAITLVADKLLEKLKQFAQTKALEADIYTKIVAWGQTEELSEKVINAIVKNSKDEPRTLSWLKNCIRFNSYSSFPESAVSAIARGWHDEPETLPWLQQHAQSDDNKYVR